MSSLGDLKKRVNQIEARNKRVESDKSWETSWTRRILLAVFTFISIGLYLRAINIKNSWLNAVVPTVGFMLSTLTLPFFKKIWDKYIKK